MQRFLAAADQEVRVPPDWKGGGGSGGF